MTSKSTVLLEACALIERDTPPAYKANDFALLLQRMRESLQRRVNALQSDAIFRRALVLDGLIAEATEHVSTSLLACS